MKQDRMEKTQGGCVHANTWGDCKECDAVALRINDMAGQYEHHYDHTVRVAMAQRIIHLEDQLREATQ